MKNAPHNRELGRVAYWEGQLLRSRDFLDIQRVADERRFWHARAMHEAYGVYRGFEAIPMEANAERPPMIQLAPGVAFDCYGRELILECVAAIPYSAQPLATDEVRTLLVRYKTPAPRNETDRI